MSAVLVWLEATAGENWFFAFTALSAVVAVVAGIFLRFFRRFKTHQDGIIFEPRHIIHDLHNGAALFPFLSLLVSPFHKELLHHVVEKDPFLLFFAGAIGFIYTSQSLIRSKT